MPATHSFNTTLDYLSGNTTIAVAEVISIEPPNLKRKAVDTTHLKSANMWRTFMAGFKDGGEIKFELSYTKDQCDALTTLFDGGNTTTWRVTFPELGQWSTSGFMTDFQDGKAQDDDRLTGSATVKITGHPTFNTNGSL